MDTLEFIVDEGLRQNAQQLLAEEGLTIPEAFSMFLRSVVHDGGPHGVRTANAETTAAIRDAGNGQLYQASSVGEFMRSLHEADQVVAPLQKR
jgi:antitoxin component of RelBE/YafQ-DinJ toxin-antitoxin module